MKRKKLPPKGKHKGLYVYCSKCKKHFGWTQRKEKTKNETLTNIEPTCNESGKRLSSCKFQDKHRYKARVNIPGPLKTKMSRTFDVDTYKEAVIKAIEFENEVFSDISSSINNNDSRNSNRHYLFDSEIKYLDFLDNVGVPEHQKVIRTDRHIKEVQKSLELFNEALTLAKVKKKIILLDQINDNHVGFFHTYLLENKNYGNKTYNNKIGALRGFFKWAIDNFNLKMTNPFDKVKRRTVVIKKETITKKEFNDLLEIISPEKGMTSQNLKQARNRYKPYLKDGIELALHTGGRREEVVELKWNMIHKIDGEPSYIAMKNFKVERQLGEGFNDNVVPKIIPITKSLLKLLYRMGYETKQGRDEYLISPDRSKTSSYAIMDNLSKGFSHFYDLLNTGRGLQLKSLRKTYLTYLNSALSGDTKKLSSHSNNDVLQKHYIDEKLINKAVKKVDIFG